MIPRIRFVEQRLPLQVAGFNVVAVENEQLAHAGTGQQRCDAGPVAPQPTMAIRARRQPLLAGRAYSREEHLPRISIMESHAFFYYMVSRKGLEFQNRREEYGLRSSHEQQACELLPSK